MSTAKKEMVTWGGLALMATLFIGFSTLILRTLGGFEEKYVTQDVFREVTSAQGELLGTKLDAVRQAIEYTRLQVGQDGNRSQALESRVRDLEQRVTALEAKQQ